MHYCIELSCITELVNVLYDMRQLITELVSYANALASNGSSFVQGLCRT
jgi:hypothetical protein